jgi:hypothetical protein
MYRFDTGAIGVCEDVWYLPEKSPYRIDGRMEIIGQEGSIYMQESPASLSLCDQSGWRSPDMTYWPLIHGERARALRAELQYFHRLPSRRARSFGGYAARGQGGRSCMSGGGRIGADRSACRPGALHAVRTR